MIKEFLREHRWLSNFWPCSIMYKENLYRTVEHAYQSAKSKDDGWKLTCLTTESPGEIKRLSKNIKQRPDWDNVKHLIMEELLRLKFKQEYFRAKLLATGSQHIQEGNTWGDRYWGVDMTVHPPIGKNMLGKIIMEIRKEITEETWNNNP